MIINFLRIKFFFFLVFLPLRTIFALDVPEPEARPEIKINKFQDVFDQIKKQNWTMAIVLAEDYNNEYLSSYIW